MFKNSLKIIGVLFLIVVICGCTTRRYSQVKERVDQEMVGNAGYLQGTPPPSAIDRGSYKKTRKIYVLEIQSKDKKQAEEATQSPSSRKGNVEVTEEPRQARKPVITVPKDVAEETPVVSESAGAANKPVNASGVSLPAEYTVEKGDTLQKISKKFYDTYRKWNKIYDANKEKIKDPNRVKSGITITIPAL